LTDYDKTKSERTEFEWGEYHIVAEATCQWGKQPLSGRLVVISMEDVELINLPQGMSLNDDLIHAIWDSFEADCDKKN
jgi:hypothetical protein